MSKPLPKLLCASSTGKSTRTNELQAVNVTRHTAPGEQGRDRDTEKREKHSEVCDKKRKKGTQNGPKSKLEGQTGDNFC